MKKGLAIMLCVFFLMSFVVVSAQYSSAETIDNAVPLALQDSTGENVGPVDLLAAQAEIYWRKVNGGPQTQKLLKITIKTTPNLPGAMIFEADVDNSSGTGGFGGWIGLPVPPCPCKTVIGTDIVLTIFHRAQGPTSDSAFCGGCTDAGSASCMTERKGGEWYALTSLSDQPVRALGFLRGYSDPTPGVIGGGTVQTSYTFPWQSIIAYANAYLSGVPGRFNNDKATANSYLDAKWQVSIYYDANYAADEDDITTSTGPGPLNVNLDINDWAPDGNGDLADMLAADDLTYCEGNFDQDSDVDGTDAATFKRNFGRSRFHRVCPDANAYY